MPTYIMKLRDRYCEWSTIVDAPTSDLLPLAEFCKLYADRHGEDGIEHLSELMIRVRLHGTSSREPMSASELIAGNRAGPGESTFTEEDLYRRYLPALERREG